MEDTSSKIRTYRYSFPLNSDLRHFGVTNCTHCSGWMKFCLSCTPCVICGDSLAFCDNYDKFSHRGKRVYAHPSCTKLGRRESAKLLVDKTTAEFSLDLTVDVQACENCDYICKSEYMKVCNQDGDIGSVHFHCIESNVCPICSDRAAMATTNFILEGRYIRHKTCMPLSCIFCGGYENITFLPIHETDQALPVHDTCLGKAECQSCGVKGGPLYHDGELIQHIGTCSSQVCIVCMKIVGPNPFRDFGNGKVYHSECMLNIECSNCGCAGGELTYINESFKHIPDCSFKICLLCGDAIGYFEREELDDGTAYHRQCANLAVCYVCEETGVGKKTKDHSKLTGEPIFRHVKCNTQICYGCDGYMGRSTIRKIHGNIYHNILGRQCGPRCRYCNEFKFTDEHNLELSEDGIYYHKECIRDECAVCLEPLGNPEKLYDVYVMNGKKISIHGKCSLICICSKTEANWEKMKPDLVIAESNKRNLPRQIKETAIVLYMIFKRMRTKITIDGVTTTVPSLPKEIRESIVIYWLYSSFNVEVINLPVKRNLFDVRLMCTEYRCTKDKCICGDTLSWCANPFYGCRKDRCGNLINTLRDIMVYILRIDINVFWPVTETSGYERVESEMLKIPSYKLGMEKLLFYTVKMPLIQHIIDMRRQKHK